MLLLFLSQIIKGIAPEFDKKNGVCLPIIIKHRSGPAKQSAHSPAEPERYIASCGERERLGRGQSE